ncbi:NUDIX domain-containing protein [Catenulispora yoronensis]
MAHSQDEAETGTDVVISLTSRERQVLGADAHIVAGYAETLLKQLAALRLGGVPESWRLLVPGAPGTWEAAIGEDATADLLWQERALSDLSALDTMLGGALDATLRRHADQGGTYGAAGLAMGVVKATAQSRRLRLHKRPLPEELWAAGAHGETDHPGMAVPDTLRSWSRPWAGYLPVDITPPALTPGIGLELSVIEGWAEDAATPYDITPEAWRQRARQALVPFDLDDRGWPLNPAGRTGRTGRNLNRWGENTAADAAMVCGDWILLIQRDDVLQWAIVGGMTEDGETPEQTMVREVGEEAHVDLSGRTPTIVRRGYVPDWRNTDHAWVCSSLGVFELDERVEAVAGDDAAAARWFRFDSIEQLAADTEPHGGLYPAHIPLLETVLRHRKTHS